MMVTFVSQCEKNALKKTRRVLDAFANRIGDNTWQTVITQEGLNAVRKLLRKTASKSTAVSCHWIRSRARSELLWVVGRRSAFDYEGKVAVNSTELDLSHKDWESGWHSNETVAIAAGLAALFHDFGKANDLFQEKLAGTAELNFEPFRHEWVSLRLFEAIVKDKTDQQWLKALIEIDRNIEIFDQGMMDNLTKDNVNLTSPNPFNGLPPFAKLVAWLIVSHHRLPLPQVSASKVDLKDMSHWLNTQFNAGWNSNNTERSDQITSSILQKNWQFTKGTPVRSQTWREHVAAIGERALAHLAHVQSENWLEQRFVSHMARMSLMLCDHYYSSLPMEKSKTKLRDDDYWAFANTDRRNKNQLKQKLDEHNIAVAMNAMKFVRNLPALKMTLPTLGRHRVFSQAAPRRFRWQDKAFAEAQACARSTVRQGFFGINMASTGCGKTMANARIMYALSDGKEECRFSVALGLRTLTLQTGDAYRDLLGLSDSEMAVLVGSTAIKQLHVLEKEKPARPLTGSESEDDLLDGLDLSYDGQVYDGRLRRWLEGSPKLQQLLSAPLLVSTIDHLMPATESLRGGKQIAPMLRLLTSDLILDEPDDFSLEDLPALCRLVNWAGMLGSRVLLSSATLPPSLVNALFDAYREGRRHFNQAHWGEGKAPLIVTGWFDEFKAKVLESPDKAVFGREHKAFVEKRVAKLASGNKILRKGGLADVPVPDMSLDKSTRREQAHLNVASAVHQCMHDLHQQHFSVSPCGKRVSLGVVRLANINPMISVLKKLVALPAQKDTDIHICVYHSQFTMAIRSTKERKLDQTLARYDEASLWQQRDIYRALQTSDKKNHIFVVFGTSVVEVGRDHDYDWAIAEPSSLRAIVQLAGRVQRHRQQEPKVPNVMVLNRNIRALEGESIAYQKPGFETSQLPLSDHDLHVLLTQELDSISAISRIIEPAMQKKDFCLEESSGHAFATDSLIVQEHRALRFALDAMPNSAPYLHTHKEASLWWRRSETEQYKHADWNGVYIKETAFRKSQPQQEYLLRYCEEELLWSQKDDSRFPAVYVPQEAKFSRVNIELAEGLNWWFQDSSESVYQQLATVLDVETEKISERFGVVGLTEYSEANTTNPWGWHEQMGVFKEWNDNNEL